MHEPPVCVTVYVSAFDGASQSWRTNPGPLTRRIKDIAGRYGAEATGSATEDGSWHTALNFTISAERCDEFCHTLTAEGFKNESGRSNHWGDQPLPEDAEIAAAHPLRSGRNDLYMEAMRLVGARRSKGALVELVTWLLLKSEQREWHPSDWQS